MDELSGMRSLNMNRIAVLSFTLCDAHLGGLVCSACSVWASDNHVILVYLNAVSSVSFNR
jgi:hypothetical protein